MIEAESTPASPAASAPPFGRGANVLVAARSLFTRRIAGKIILPYLVLLVLVALLATRITIDMLDSSLEEKYREELAAAGRSANEAMVLLEDRNLTSLRHMAFTEGVDRALADNDTAALQRLIAPIAANDRIAYVDVFGADGAQLLSLRATSLGPDASARVDPSAGQSAPIQYVLRGASDQLGDKYAGIVATPWGRMFVSAAPVRLDDDLVGAIAVSVPIDEVASRLSQEAGSRGITIYDVDGSPMVSTIRASASTLAEALTLPSDQRAAALRGNDVVVRRSRVGDVLYVEALGALAIRREPNFVVGTGNVINIIEERGAQARVAMIVLFAGVLVLVLAIGIALARRITQPVYALVEATDRVRRNDLDFEVPVRTEDEHGILTEAFNEMRGGLRERERSRAAIERYMSPKVYRLIQAGELSMGGVSREITVFKSDIRDFTPLSEKMEPEALVDFLNRYFEAMVAAITKYDGEVDKYMGDSILAKFGATEWYPDHARKAVLAMVEMVETCEAFNQALVREGAPPIRMGIGGNTGTAVVGNIGSTDRMEYTIISDAVNTAQRIEELCKEVGWDLLISEETYKQASDVVEVGRPWSIRLRGRTRDTLVYPILGRMNAVPPARRRAYDGLLKEQGGAAAPRA
ncbi:MAG TPA: adenylate/guanylate cyclase domain-containing protein [Chloroflexota bacterium]|nr:adenylate/guanylate cyclase domain-containing protein [Chloroflexota bacterium]